MFRVSVESSAGVALGGGPLLSATRATVTHSIDRAGSVAFDMPATDPDSASFAAAAGALSVYVRIRAFRNGTWITAGRGIITKKDLDSSGKMLRLSGPSIEHELTRTHVGTLSLTDNPLVPEVPMAAADVLPAIMAYALAGWTTSGTPSGDVYYQFGDETVLAALIKVAEILGDHFRFDVEDRIVEWLPTTAAGFDAAASGVRATDIGDPDELLDAPEIAILDGGLQVSTDDTERITRIYPRGAGNAGARLYLNGTTWTAPAGYTLVINAGEPAQSYIKHDASDAAGVVSLAETLRDIAPLKESAAAQIAASDQLAVAAHKMLMRRLFAQKAYRMRLTKLHMDLNVGDTVYVKSKHFTDGYKWIDEGADLMVNDIRSDYQVSGEPLHDLDVTL